jgi:putative phosphoribosyl transferase
MKPEKTDSMLSELGQGGVELSAVIECGGHRLEGELVVPPHPVGIVLFAHGSGSSRLSPRNQQVAQALQQAGLATLLFDLLEEREASDRRNVFDVELLAGRLLAAVDWVRQQPGLKQLPLGFFGASTGAAAALIAAARSSQPVSAVVSRGGRPDLAEPWLDQVEAPTLLIVGGEDDQVIQMNRSALARLASPARLEIVPGATHLFEEPGALEEVARLAVEWFGAHLGEPMDSYEG